MIYSFRRDGLTERINAILNAYRISQLISLPFYFTWPENNFVQNRTDHCVPLDCHKLLSDEIVNENYLSTDILNLNPEMDYILKNIHKFEHDDFSTYENGTPFVVKTRLPRNLPKEQSVFLSDEFLFKNILFSEEVNSVLKLIDTLFLQRSFDAIHFRSGDVVYGHHRLHGAYARSKTLTYTAVIQIAEVLSEKKCRDVVIFGANTNLLKNISLSYKNVFTLSDLIELNLSPDMSMLAEAYFMSKCENLYGTKDSGVTHLAKRIGNVKLITADQAISDAEHFKLLARDIQNRECKFPLDKFQRSHAIIYAYSIGCTNNTFDILDSLLSFGFEEDSEMEIFIFVRLFNAIRFDRNSVVEMLMNKIKHDFNLSSPIELAQYCASKFKVLSFIGRSIRISSNSKLFAEIFDEECQCFLKNHFDMGRKN